MHHVVVAFAHGTRFQPGGVQAGIGFRHGETGLVLAGDQVRQPARALRRVAEHHHRVQPEDIHMDGGGAGEARAGRRDGLHHQRGLGHAQAGAAVLRRHGDSQPAVARQVDMQVVRKPALAVALQPIVVRVAGANLVHRVADGDLFRVNAKSINVSHRRWPGRPAAPGWPVRRSRFAQDFDTVFAQPRRGRRSAVGVPSKRPSGAGVRSRPSVGCSTVRTKPVARRCGSATRSSIPYRREAEDIGGGQQPQPVFRVACQHDLGNVGVDLRADATSIAGSCEQIGRNACRTAAEIVHHQHPDSSVQ